jgi:hypothetical protein
MNTINSSHPLGKVRQQRHGDPTIGEPPAPVVRSSARFHDYPTDLSIIEIAMQLRSTQPPAFDHFTVPVGNREFKDRLRKINCYSRGCHWMLPVLLLTRPPDIAISANVLAISKKPIPSFHSKFSETQARFKQANGRCRPFSGNRASL